MAAAATMMRVDRVTALMAAIVPTDPDRWISPHGGRATARPVETHYESLTGSRYTWTVRENDVIARQRMLVLTR